MTILDNNMNLHSAANMVISALQRAKKADFDSYRWTFYNRNATEIVQYNMGKLESSYTYSRYFKFLWFKFEVEKFYLSSSDPYFNYTEWHRIGDAMNTALVRFGIN